MTNNLNALYQSDVGGNRSWVDIVTIYTLTLQSTHSRRYLLTPCTVYRKQRPLFRPSTRDMRQDEVTKAPRTNARETHPQPLYSYSQSEYTTMTPKLPYVNQNVSPIYKETRARTLSQDQFHHFFFIIFI